MLAELSADELREWEAYAILEPFGAPWKQTALLAMLFANAYRNTDERPEPYEIADFLPPEPDVPVVRDEAEAEEDANEPHWMKIKRLFQLLADAQKENQA